MDLNGNQPFKGLTVPFVEESVIQASPFEEEGPDNEDYNSDDGIVTHYDQSVCIIHFH